MRVAVALALGWMLVAATAGCQSPSAGAARPRTYRLGFAATPPRLDIADVLRTIDLWRPRADAALLAITPPWRALLADTSAALLVRR